VISQTMFVGIGTLRSLKIIYIKNNSVNPH
jgi:hypothetical protein